jgi:hypothetical protein
MQRVREGAARFVFRGKLIWFRVRKTCYLYPFFFKCWLG